MVKLKSPAQIESIRKGGKILAAILGELVKIAKPGVTTKSLSEKARILIEENSVMPSFLGYHNYPDVICLSVNNQAVHTPGSEYVLRDGDLLKLDFGVVVDGMHSDSAITVLIAIDPNADRHEDKRRLMQVTREALSFGIAQCKVGNTLGDVGHAIQEHIEKNGYSVVRELGGHGIGEKLHEEPWVANYGKPGTGIRLEAGMVLALEPITSTGSWQVVDGTDGHTYETKDGSLSAHFEHSVAVTEKGPDVLTK